MTVNSIISTFESYVTRRILRNILEIISCSQIYDICNNNYVKIFTFKSRKFREYSNIE